jgi:excisionase family DNA binding protein
LSEDRRDGLTAEEAARLIGGSRPTLIRLLKSGEIPFRRTHGAHGHRRVSRVAALSYLRADIVRCRQAPDELAATADALYPIRVGDFMLTASSTQLLGRPVVSDVILTEPSETSPLIDLIWALPRSNGDSKRYDHGFTGILMRPPSGLPSPLTMPCHA